MLCHVSWLFVIVPCGWVKINFQKYVYVNHNLQITRFTSSEIKFERTKGERKLVKKIDVGHVAFAFGRLKRFLEAD